RAVDVDGRLVSDEHQNPVVAAPDRRSRRDEGLPAEFTSQVPGLGYANISWFAIVQQIGQLPAGLLSGITSHEEHLHLPGGGLGGRYGGGRGGRHRAGTAVSRRARAGAFPGRT